jgi:membrane-bound lytic murein transglycosylase A
MGALSGRGLELLFLSSWADLFFLQVQGSGKVRLPDGSIRHLNYAGKSGLPYTSIGKILIQRGEIDREKMSMEAIRNWLKLHPEKSRELMWENKSYVFFSLSSPEGRLTGPIGAQGLPLKPFRSIAIDRHYWALGVPVWVESSVFNGGEMEPFNRLMIAQDTGSAIKGAARGDIFFGSGFNAGQAAGKMNQDGDIYALVPKKIVERLLKAHEP